MPVKTKSQDPVFAIFVFFFSVLFLFTVTGLLDAAFAQGNPFGTGPRPSSSPQPMGGLAGWIFAKQAEFNLAIRGFVREAKNDGAAFWGLLGASFLYGIFHALGPGHGKAVISSYVVANNETRWRGVVLSFVSALLQAVTAVLFVGIAKFVFSATQPIMCTAEYIIEMASYVFIVLIGVRLLWVKGRGFFRTIGEIQQPKAALGAAVTPHDHHHGHDHHHHHDHNHEHSAACDHDDSAWSHAHGPEPADLRGKHWLRRGLSAVLAVGIRPCSGAIIVLIFALSQGIFWAGAEATFVMALGTGITVAAIATLALTAKDFAKNVAEQRSGLGMLVMRGFEVGAAALIILFGLLLLAGYMWSERLPLC